MELASVFRRLAGMKRRLHISIFVPLIFGIMGLAFLSAAFAEKTNNNQVLVDEVVAAVGSVAITRSQVIQEARFILAEQRQNWAGILPAKLLESVKERLIGKQLIYIEVQRGGYDDPVRGELLEKFISGFTSRQQYDRFREKLGMTAASLEALLSKNERIEDYMQRRLKMMAQVRDADIVAEIEQMSRTGRLQDPKLKDDPDFRVYIRSELEKKRTDTALKTWLADLSSRTRVLRLVIFERDVPAITDEIIPSGATNE